jgi:hypothetical protein
MDNHGLFGLAHRHRKQAVGNKDDPKEFGYYRFVMKAPFLLLEAGRGSLGCAPFELRRGHSRSNERGRNATR